MTNIDLQSTTQMTNIDLQSTTQMTNIDLQSTTQKTKDWTTLCYESIYDSMDYYFLCGLIV